MAGDFGPYLDSLCRQHAALDVEIETLEKSPYPDWQAIQEKKRAKLALKDRISEIRAQACK